MPQYIEDELWGLHLAPHKTYSQEVEMPFRVTMAALNAKLESQERSSVFVRVDDIEYVLCSLMPNAVEQQLLNHTFVLGEKITFYTNGENAIHLTGNFLTLDEELDEGYPIDLNTASEDEEGEEDEEDEDEFDSEMDEEITSEEDQDEEDSNAEFNSEDEDEPKIKELSAEEEKQLVAEVNKKIKELKSKRAQSQDDDEEDDDISVDENLSFEDDEEEDEDDEEDSEFDSELDEEDFDEDASEEDSEMESEEEEEPVVVKADKRMNPKAQVMESKKPKIEVVETPKKNAPKPAATATPQPAKEAPKASQAKDTPKQAAAVAPKSKDTPKPTVTTQPKTDAPATKENQAAEANVQPQQPAKPVMKTLPSGLKMEDLKVGDGMKVKLGRKVAIAYKGSLTNGKVFDSSKPGNPLEFHVGNGDVVKGLEMGVQGMALNGTRRITIPAALAYGAKELPGIPKNSTLVFEVTIQSVSSK